MADTRYRETTAWQGLSAATRRQRENIFRQVIASAGDQPFARITSATIAAGRDRRAATPAQARHFLDAMRGLFRWATKAQLVKADPTTAVDDPRRPQSDGFPPWTEEHVAMYQKRFPIGTRQRIWLDVLLYTGLRRGDAVRLGRQHLSSTLRFFAQILDAGPEDCRFRNNAGGLFDAGCHASEGAERNPSFLRQ